MNIKLNNKIELNFDCIETDAKKEFLTKFLLYHAKVITRVNRKASIITILKDIKKNPFRIYNAIYTVKVTEKYITKTILEVMGEFLIDLYDNLTPEDIQTGKLDDSILEYISSDNYQEIVRSRMIDKISNINL